MFCAQAAGRDDRSLAPVCAFGAAVEDISKEKLARALEYDKEGSETNARKEDMNVSTRT
jgi:hypothetical protein